MLCNQNNTYERGRVAQMGNTSNLLMRRHLRPPDVLQIIRMLDPSLVPSTSTAPFGYDSFRWAHLPQAHQPGDVVHTSALS